MTRKSPREIERELSELEADGPTPAALDTTPDQRQAARELMKWRRQYDTSTVAEPYEPETELARQWLARYPNRDTAFQVLMEGLP
jgi:hypothetical protein